ncbi:MAG TPA: nitrite reductase [Candidatus Latescibacteria bacterium]|nr:nitrite reductase [Candidatus Latescibacterota bacterium]
MTDTPQRTSNESFPCPGWWKRAFRNRRLRKWSFGILVAVGCGLAIRYVLVPWGFQKYTGVVNAELSYPNSKAVSEAEFEAIAADLRSEGILRRALALTSSVTDSITRKTRIRMIAATPSFQRQEEFAHIRYFRDAGIRRYEGPKTCIRCHETIDVRKPDGTIQKVKTIPDVLNTIHYKFQSMDGGFTTYGYDGRQVNTGTRGIPVGKIDRACGVPGSFSWTGWAALIETKPAHAGGEVVLRSEGCGQCHIGGGYHPATENMMPGLVVPTPKVAAEGLDCLICHASAYDMNQRFVIRDEHGLRWNQDRSLRAALSVGRPTNENCLNCHQHNMGGDTYAYNTSAQSLGTQNQRLLHSTAKRGNPFSVHDDVHARAGLVCLDCHRPQGHKIPRGNKGTDLVANDLPDVKVECEMCHTSAPHVRNRRTRAALNGHADYIACETCHIARLLPFNNVLKDWVHPVWNEEEGMYVPKAVYSSGDPNRGLAYLWFNGNGTFLANALGANPNHSPDYNPLMRQIVMIEDPVVLGEIAANTRDIRTRYGLDSASYMAPIANALSQLSPEMLSRRREMIERNLRVRMNEGKSRIYPFKLFNAMMFEDLNNEGPFGAMILPFDYRTYFETGDAENAVKVAVANPIVKRMYETPFKLYMMDEFMAYFGVGKWTAKYPLDEGNWNVQPRWMRQMGTLMVNHGIQPVGRQCAECHNRNGILDFAALGYTTDRVRALQNLPELSYFQPPLRPSHRQEGAEVQAEATDASER